MPMSVPSKFGSVRVANERLKEVLEDVGEIGHVQVPQANGRTVAIPAVVEPIVAVGDGVKRWMRAPIGLDCQLRTSVGLN
jgi:hypothetical protein